MRGRPALALPKPPLAVESGVLLALALSKPPLAPE